jgi:hypothetical protein
MTEPSFGELDAERDRLHAPLALAGDFIAGW